MGNAINLDRFSQKSNKIQDSFGTNYTVHIDLMREVNDVFHATRDYVVRPLASSITNVSNLWDLASGTVNFDVSTLATFTDNSWFARIFKRPYIIGAVGLKTTGAEYLNGNYTIDYLKVNSNGNPDIESNWVNISLTPAPGDTSVSNGQYHTFNAVYALGIRVKVGSNVSVNGDKLGAFHIYAKELVWGVVSGSLGDNQDYSGDLYIADPDMKAMDSSNGGSPALTTSITDGVIDLGAETRVEEIRAHYADSASGIMSVSTSTDSVSWTALTLVTHDVHTDASKQGNSNSFDLYNVTPSGTNSLTLVAGSVAIIPLLNIENALSSYIPSSGENIIPGILTKVEMCLYAPKQGGNGNAETEIYVVRQAPDGSFYRISYASNSYLARIEVACPATNFDKYTFSLTPSAVGSNYTGTPLGGTVVQGVRPTDYIAIFNKSVAQGANANAGQTLTIGIPNSTGKTFVVSGAWAINTARQSSGLSLGSGTGCPQIRIEGTEFRKAGLSTKNIRYVKFSHNALSGKARGIFSIKPMNKNASGVSSPAFTGGGLNDAAFHGAYTSVTASSFEVEIDGTGTPNTFKWRKPSGSGSFTTGVSCSTSPVYLSDGISVSFGATTGHTLTNKWIVTAEPGGFPDITDLLNSGSVEITEPLSITLSSFGAGTETEIKVRNDGIGGAATTKTGVTVSVDPDGSEASFFTEVSAVANTGPYIGHCLHNTFTACSKNNANFQKVRDDTKGIVGCGQLCTQENGGGSATGGFEAASSSASASVTQGQTKSIWLRPRIESSSGAGLGGTRPGKLKIAWLSSTID